MSLRTPLLGALLAAATVVGCTGGGAERTANGGEDTMAERSITEVQEAHTPEWMEVSGVVGTGVGLCEGDPCIKVFVSERTPEVDDEIPGEVEGYTVQVEVTGSFRTRSDTGVG